MATVNEKMTALADEIRTLSGTTGTMGLDAMASNIGDANTEISRQADIIAQIQTAVNILPETGNSGASIETCTPLKQNTTGLQTLLETINNLPTGGQSLIINVETGSSVTISNSSTGKSYTETSVDGEVVFEGLSIGTWVVTATKDDKTVTRTIEIAHPELSLVYEITLYYNGDDNDSITGGWTSLRSTGSGVVTTSRANNNISWIQLSGSGGTGAYVTTNSIDLTNFNTISFRGNWNSHGVGNIIVLSDDFTEWNDWANYTIISVPVEEIDWDNEGTDPTTDPVQTVDISSISGSYRVGIGIGGSSTPIVRMADFKLS